MPDHRPEQASSGEVRVLAIANQKGGVGKTTTAVNLATALAMRGERVLLIDMDPQGNASTGLGIAQMQRLTGSYRLLMDGHPQADTVQPTAVANLSLIPAEADLVGAEVELVDFARREFRLREALTEYRREDRFTFILIDCPPSLGLLTLNALVAADGVLVPLQCEFYALEGITALMRTVEAVRRQLNQAIKLYGIILTMFDRRNSISGLVAADARGFFGDWVYDTVIPRNIRLSEAQSHGQSILQYDIRSAGAQAYVQLATELIEKMPEGPRQGGLNL